MEADFWHERWEANQLGFHQTEVNPLLAQHWPALELPRDATVFVPLCGKSLDMRWLGAAGHPVIGVEISPIAVRDFFVEARIEPDHDADPSTQDSLERLSGGGYTLYRGDLFDLEQRHLADVRGVYDRASLIALPPETRQRYASHLTKVLPPSVEILLITIEYDPSRMQGPPHSVSEGEVEDLYGANFEIHRLWSSGPEEPTERFRERGLDSWSETIWRLVRGAAP